VTSLKLSSFALLPGVLLGVMAAGCGSVAAPPAAVLVKITRNATDVTNCMAVGNLDHPALGQFGGDAASQARNQAVALGGNVVLDTTPQQGTTMAGAVYYCGNAGPSEK